MNKHIVTVDESLINIASTFICDVFIDYYTPLIGEKQATYMTDLFLSEKAIKEELQKGTVFKLVYFDKTIVGFTEYKLEKEKVFLSKLYVHKDYRKQGISKIMLNECINYAKENNRKAIYLTCNKYNQNSLQVYNHYGFEIIDSVKSDIGNNYIMDDYILELKEAKY